MLIGAWQSSALACTYWHTPQLPSRRWVIFTAPDYHHSATTGNRCLVEPYIIFRTCLGCPSIQSSLLRHTFEERGAMLHLHRQTVDGFASTLGKHGFVKRSNSRKDDDTSFKLVVMIILTNALCQSQPVLLERPTFPSLTSSVGVRRRSA